MKRQTNRLPRQPRAAHMHTPAPIILRLNRDGTLPKRHHGRHDPDFLAWAEANLHRALVHREALKREFRQEMTKAMSDVKTWRSRLDGAQRHAQRHADHQTGPAHRSEV